jgi:hypothetical protein
MFTYQAAKNYESGLGVSSDDPMAISGLNRAGFSVGGYGFRNNGTQRDSKKLKGAENGFFCFGVGVGQQNHSSAALSFFEPLWCSVVAGCRGYAGLLPTDRYL